MHDEDDRPRPASLLEQHIGTLLQLVVVGLLAWSLQTTQSLSNDVAVLKSQVALLSATLNQGTSDRYRGADAARDFGRVDHDIRRLDERLLRLETRK